MLINILGITADAKGYEMVRQLRWPDGVGGPHRAAARVVRQGVTTLSHGDSVTHGALVAGGSTT